jgi:lipopolysaccharide biosynthesis glycosyltransferase
MKKNLIYYICDNAYKDILQINLKCFNKNNNKDIDTCCIVPKGFQFLENDLKPTHIIEVDNFDFKYTAKFIINKLNLASNYENFLYLDVDAIPVKSLESVFECIENQKNIIHGVKEVDCLNTNIGYFKFSDTNYDLSIKGFNAGTFGFNKINLNSFNILLEYINSVKNKAVCDQPIFNEFFSSLNLIQPTLSDFVYLKNIGGAWDSINKISIKDSSIIHFLGACYTGKDLNYINSIISEL